MSSLYFYTKRGEISSILRKGLQPVDDKPIRLSETLFEKQEREAGAMLEINVNDLELYQDKNNSHMLFKGVISPERIKKIFVSTDDNPYFFKELINYL